MENDKELSQQQVAEEKSKKEPGNQPNPQPEKDPPATELTDEELENEIKIHQAETERD